MPANTPGSAFPFFGGTDGAGTRLAMDYESPFWAEITGADGEGRYAWRELWPTTLPQRWRVPVSASTALSPGGSVLLVRSGSLTRDYAVEASGNADVPAGAVVVLYRGLFQGGDSQDYRFSCGCRESAGLFVRMTRDAVAQGHPEYAAGPNAVVQEREDGDWADGETLLEVFTLDSLPNAANGNQYNGRLPLRRGDRFWVIRHPSGLLVPTYEPRSAGVRLAHDAEAMSADGMYPGYVRLTDDVTLTESDGDAVWVIDGNGLGLNPGVYSGCDLVGHRRGRCLYRATCCAPLQPTSSSDSQSQSSSSDSQSQSGCGCAPDACGGCAAGYTSAYWQIVVDLGVTDPGSPCYGLQGTFTLAYVGSCTWQTTSSVDQRTTGGRYGPTWKLVWDGANWRLLAAGSDVGVAGTTGDCNTPIYFTLNGWAYGSNRGGCVVPGGYLTVTPLCSCPESSSSSSSSSSSASSGTCAPICSRCGASPCHFTVDLAGFGSGSGCTGSCVSTPARFEVYVSDFEGCLADLNGFYEAEYTTGCTWLGTLANGATVVVHTQGGNQIGALFALATGPIFPQASYTGLIPESNCCDPLTLAFQRQLWNTSACPATSVRQGPATVTLTPVCSEAAGGTCDELNAGVVTLTSTGDCTWTGSANGVDVTLVFDGVSWTLTASSSDKTVLYRAINTDCCGPGVVEFVLDTADCSSPATLTITAASPCDNCCASTSTSSTSASSDESGSAAADGTICNTNCCSGPLPQYWQLVVAGVVNTEACLECEQVNGTYLLEYTAGCNWSQVGTFPQICGVDASYNLLLAAGIGAQLSLFPGGGGWTLGPDEMLCCGVNALDNNTVSVTCDTSAATATLTPLTDCSQACTDCDEQGLPATLYAVLDADPDDCPCVGAGPAIPLAYDSANAWWAGVGAFGTCGRAIAIKVRCSSGAWQVATAFADCCDEGGDVDPDCGITDTWFALSPATGQPPLGATLTPLAVGCGCALFTVAIVES